jgi:hypothetical protein
MGLGIEAPSRSQSKHSLMKPWKYFSSVESECDKEQEA